MVETNTEPMGWATILAILIATGLVVGVTLGLLRETVGVPGGTAGVGVSIGVVAAILIARRRAALARRGLTSSGS